jgi:hypothetical protein
VRDYGERRAVLPRRNRLGELSGDRPGLVGRLDEGGGGGVNSSGPRRRMTQRLSRSGSVTKARARERSF